MILQESQLYRDELRLLTDDQLLVRCIVLKRLEREKKEGGYCCPLLTRAWYECEARGRADLFEAALVEVRREEQEHRAANARALRALLGR